MNTITKLLLAAAILAAHNLTADDPTPPGNQDRIYQKAFDQAIDKALRHLAQTQSPDGSFPGNMSGNTAVASLCAMAFLARGHLPGLPPHGQTINRCVDFVISAQAPDGSLVGKGGGHMYSHCIATLMLSEVSGHLDPRRQRRVDQALAKALCLILDAQKIHKAPQHRGGWRYSQNSKDSDLSLSGWALMALRSARNNGAPVPKQAIDDAIEYVAKCRGTNNGFAYQPNAHPNVALTGLGILAFKLCGRHDDPRAEKAGDYLLQHFNIESCKKDHFFYACYYCAQGMFQLGGDRWEQFAPRLYEGILKLQNPDGSWSPQSKSERAPGTSYATAMAVLALSVTYRQLPIYQR